MFFSQILFLGLSLIKEDEAKGDSKYKFTLKNRILLPKIVIKDSKQINEVVNF
jgi:hypothetical protein